MLGPRPALERPLWHPRHCEEVTNSGDLAGSETRGCLPRRRKDIVQRFGRHVLNRRGFGQRCGMTNHLRFEGRVLGVQRKGCTQHRIGGAAPVTAGSRSFGGNRHPTVIDAKLQRPSRRALDVVESRESQFASRPRRDNGCSKARSRHWDIGTCS